MAIADSEAATGVYTTVEREDQICWDGGWSRAMEELSGVASCI
jgi:hypothetical protein